MSTFLADQSALDQTQGGFDISDTAANITANLDQLDDPHIDVFTILDNGRIGASVQQLTSDATAIGKLKNANSSPVLLAINDTAADVEAGLSTLVAETGEIASITASGGPVVVSAATFLADQSTLDKIVGGFAISDTAFDVAQRPQRIERRHEHHLDRIDGWGNADAFSFDRGGVERHARSQRDHQPLYGCHCG